MNRRKQGKNYETGLCGDIYERTNEELFPEPIGFSGNHAVPAPDIKIDDGIKIHAMELKTTKNDRISLTHDAEDRQKDDLWQLFDYAERFPRTVIPYAGIRFNNRQLLLLKFWARAPNVRAVLQSGVNDVPTDVRLTNSDNLSVHKPDLDIWPSSKKGDDVEYLLDTISYNYK